MKASQRKCSRTGRPSKRAPEGTKRGPTRSPAPKGQSSRERISPAALNSHCPLDVGRLHHTDFAVGQQRQSFVAEMDRFTGEQIGGAPNLACDIDVSRAQAIRTLPDLLG